MPIIKSAVKRVRQSEKRRLRNVQTKKQLKGATKALDAAIESKDTKKIDDLLGDVYSSYDTAVKKNLIHKNKAARKKAHYSAAVKALGAKKPAAKKTSAKKAPAKKPAAKKTTTKK